MRLSQYEQDAIINLYHHHFPSSQGIWLFGSRVDDTKRGGDIDLFIEMASDEAAAIYRARMNFLIDLKNQIGDQKIDLVIKSDNSDLLIYKIAKSEGIKLA